MSVRLSTNGQQFVTAPTTFTYHAEASVLSLDPASGSVNGGTPVVVRAEPALWTTARCAAGLARRCRRRWIRERDADHLSCTCAVRAGHASRLAVANNGVDLAAASARFEYRAAMRVDSVAPRSGPVTGGTRVLVSGGGFAVASERAVCRFGEAVVSADVLDTARRSRAWRRRAPRARLRLR